MNIENLKKRNSILRDIRSFFDGKEYLEVDTPLLSPSLIPESCIEVFKTEFLNPFKNKKDLFMVPSPEIWMKQLVARGAGDIYQICKCFRNSESVGRLHNPEFTMLEWYSADADYFDSIERTEELIRFLNKSVSNPVQLPFRRMSMEQAFWEYAGFDLSKAGKIDYIIEETHKLRIHIHENPTWEEVFNLIFLTKVETALPEDKPLILYNYPAGVASLAKPVEGTIYCQRWELYIKGIEIANCYSEENDYNKLKNYFELEAEDKKGALVPHPWDEEVLTALAIENCKYSGVALGIDRLIMVLTGESSIKGVILFPFDDIL